MILAGQVTATDGTPLAGATVDIWHTDAEGWYSGFASKPPAGNLRGVVALRRPGPLRDPHPQARAVHDPPRRPDRADDPGRRLEPVAPRAPPPARRRARAPHADHASCSSPATPTSATTSPRPTSPSSPSTRSPPATATRSAPTATSCWSRSSAMETRQLRYFVAVAETRHFGRAAEAAAHRPVAAVPGDPAAGVAARRAAVRAHHPPGRPHRRRRGAAARGGAHPRLARRGPRPGGPRRGGRPRAAAGRGDGAGDVPPRPGAGPARSTAELPGLALTLHHRDAHPGPGDRPGRAPHRPRGPAPAGVRPRARPPPARPRAPGAGRPVRRIALRVRDALA